MNKLLIVGAVTAALAACASAPQRSEQVEQARAKSRPCRRIRWREQSAGGDLDAARKSTAAGRDWPCSRSSLRLSWTTTRISPSVTRRRVKRAPPRRIRGRKWRADRMSATRSSWRHATATPSNAQAAAELRETRPPSAQAQLASAQQQLADLQAKQTDRGMVVTLGDVLFDTGQATLKPGPMSAINRLARSSARTRRPRC